MLTIGILREGKYPPDQRTPLIPQQCAYIRENFPVKIIIQPSKNRCYPDEAYKKAGVLIQESPECDFWFGVKEVPIDWLQNDKTYFFFSHTIKSQSYNRRLLQVILERRIRLVDWETLTNDQGERLIAFGKYAGMVGAHNGIYAYGKRKGLFDLIRLYKCRDYNEAKQYYKSLSLPPIKIVLTGQGRVAMGAAMVLDDMQIRKVSPGEFLNKTFHEPVYTQLGVRDYSRKKDGSSFTNEEFYKHPQLFESNFEPYVKTASIFMNGIYWDNMAPAFFTLEDMCSQDFKIEVIADITCDIAPVSSVPSTIRPSTIFDPVYGFDPHLKSETAPYQEGSVDIMAIDNLPNELPRDASEAFGQQLIAHVIPELIKGDASNVIKRATIAQKGSLMPNFDYLRSFVEQKTE